MILNLKIPLAADQEQTSLLLRQRLTLLKKIKGYQGFEYSLKAIMDGLKERHARTISKECIAFWLKEASKEKANKFFPFCKTIKK